MDIRKQSQLNVKKFLKILTKYDDKLQKNDDHDYYDQDYDDQDPHDNDDHFKEAPL